MPALTVRLAGANAKFWIVTVFLVAGAVVVGGLAGVLVLGIAGALGAELEVPPEPVEEGCGDPPQALSSTSVLAVATARPAATRARRGEGTEFGCTVCASLLVSPR
ncbi:hypothetical protein [Kitasatospora sp. NPDC001175]|uniref:hypothetical protein n=1 Tax=Kitasatospora sp. NPDC001175 TaxID=3157103 RepID=UPI003CFC60FC